MKIPYVDLAAQVAPLRGEILEAIGRVLDHGQFILGPEVAELESRLAALLGAAHVVAVGSGTGALELGLRLAGVGAGDEVITVSHSFVATASAVVAVGARPVFVDIDPRTMLMDAAAAERAVTTRTRALMPVHLNGYPCEMHRITELCTRHGLALVEDCAQALGARFRGRAVGTFGIGCFSLHPLKVLAAGGDAGFVAVADDGPAERLRRLRNLGLADRDHCVEIAGNCRLDTLQAALVLAKLGRLERWLTARREHVRAYREALVGWVELPPEADADHEPVWSSFVVRHDDRDRLIGALARAGVDARVHYPIPIHRQPAFAGLPAPGPLPVTERTVATMISLPVSPELSAEGRGRVIEAIRRHAREGDAR